MPASNNPYATALRFILAGAEQLHDKIFELGDRVRQLEEALDEVYQELYVGKNHPLLAPDLLKIKTSQELYGSAGHFSPPDARVESLHQSVGALSLSSQPTYAESSRPTVSAEYMSQNAPPDVALDVLQLSATFPFPWAVDVSMRQRIARRHSVYVRRRVTTHFGSEYLSSEALSNTTVADTRASYS